VPAFIDLTGKKFNRLLVLGRADTYVAPRGHTRIRWNCLCDCGKEIVTTGAAMKDGGTKSCGCARFKQDKSSTHPLYEVWRSMRQRCYYTKGKAYKYYGGRGITICDRWKDSFVNFI